MSRPIRLDEVQIRDLAQKAAQQLFRTGLPRPGRVFYSGYYADSDVRGKSLVVEVIFSGAPSVGSDPFRRELLNGGYFSRKEGKVWVFLNPHMPIRSFEAMPRKLVYEEIYRILAHELTHASDVIRGKGSVGDLSSSMKKLLRHHHNHPAEVKSLLRDVVTQSEDSVREYLAMGIPLRDALSAALQDTKWSEIEPYLTARNRKTILKGVYTHLQDRGLVASALVASTVYFHGTSVAAAQKIMQQGFSLQSVGQRQRALRGDDTLDPKGVFVTSDRTQARWYAGPDPKRPGLNRGGAVVKVRVSGRLMPDKAWWKLKAKISKDLGITGLYDPRRGEVVLRAQEEAKRQGYAGFHEHGDEYVVFDVKNVKPIESFHADSGEILSRGLAMSSFLDRVARAHPDLIRVATVDWSKVWVVWSVHKALEPKGWGHKAFRRACTKLGGVVVGKEVTYSKAVVYSIAFIVVGEQKDAIALEEKVATTWKTLTKEDADRDDTSLDWRDRHPVVHMAPWAKGQNQPLTPKNEYFPKGVRGKGRGVELVSLYHKKLIPLIDKAIKAAKLRKSLPVDWSKTWVVFSVHKSLEPKGWGHKSFRRECTKLGGVVVGKETLRSKAVVYTIAFIVMGSQKDAVALEEKVTATWKLIQKEDSDRDDTSLDWRSREPVVHLAPWAKGQDQPLTTKNEYLPKGVRGKGGGIELVSLYHKKLLPLIEKVHRRAI